jgi:NAD(P)-dependent dehydrogenase (short-subunit alcohol dehydrogenase family)
MSVVIVTGGTFGLGQSITVELARRGHQSLPWTRRAAISAPQSVTLRQGNQRRAAKADIPLPMCPTSRRPAGFTTPLHATGHRRVGHQRSDRAAGHG